ncbi:MAG: hypothetical protein CML44_04020 [Rhodobacteraceae bacterium]|nr:hypothetical protein [Paracoccaceae bacterium]|tara:strand:- start:255 stop:842 length:588 start_codon:yes stop_codon:yes gene_type:complete
MSAYELSVDTTAKGYGHKEWSNPTNTEHRLYLHRFEGKHKKDCGHIDLLKKEYYPAKKSNRKADDIEYCLDGEGDVVFLIKVDSELLSVTKMQSQKIVKATNKKNILDKSDDPQQVIQHLASVHANATSITVSYGNTVEVKTKGGFGNIQTQYPKMSMEIKIEGGSEIPNLTQVADNLVKLVENKLTEIVNDISG